MTNETITFPIPVDSIGPISDVVNKLNKRALKKGFTGDALKWSIDNKRTKTLKIKREGNHEISKVTTEVVDITFNITPIGIEGFELVGVTNTEDGISTLNTFREDIDLTHERGTCECDHCGHKRKRNSVYFVAKPQETKYVRVGSTCLQDFFPKSVDILRKFEFYNEIWVTVKGFRDDEDGFFGGHVEPRFTTKTILALTSAAVREYGYTSATAARNNYLLIPTKNVVTNSIFTDRNEDKLEVIEDDEKKAEEILNWFSNNDEESEYFENCRQIIEKGYFRSKYIAYIVGLYGAWRHHNNQKVEYAQRAESKHVGHVGERQTFLGKITAVREIHSQFSYDGVGYITTVEDSEGNILKYFNLIRPNNHDWSHIDDLVGLEVQFDAGVKKHDEWNGQKQTALTRVTKAKVMRTAVPN